MDQNVTAPVEQSPAVASPAVLAKPGSVEAPEEKKKGKGMIFGMVIFAILAFGGIGFGVWAFMDGESRVEITKKQCASTEITTNCNVSDDNDRVNFNPVISSLGSAEKYSVDYVSSPVYLSANESPRLRIYVTDGAITECRVGVGIGEECNISGLSGDIYKIIEFGSGQDNSNSNVGFIMTDGSVKYLPLYDSVENNDFSIRGDLKIDGHVVDAFDIGVTPTDSEVGGYGATVFVLSDNSYIKFSESLL